MRAPVFNSYVNYNVRAFNALVNPSAAVLINLVLAGFLLPFAKRVRFGMGTFRSTPSQPNTEIRPMPPIILIS